MGDLPLRQRVPWRCHRRATAMLLAVCVAMALVPTAMAADATHAPAASAWVPWTAAPTPTVASAPVAATRPKPPAPTHTPKAPATTTAKATAPAPTTPKATATATAPAPTPKTAPAPATATHKAPVAATSLSTSATPAANTTCDPHYETWNATTARCDCQRGFSGLGCRMCAHATDCQRAFASPAMTCATGLDYRNASAVKTYDCALDASLQQLFADGALAVGCDRASRNCSVAVFKRHETVRSDHVIDCVLSGCDFPTGGGGGGRCALIECKCGKACSALTKAVVEQSLSGKPATIHVSNGSALSIDIEGAPLPLSATCTASACERVPSGGGSGSGSGSGGGDSDHGGVSGLLLALVASGALALLLALGVCCGSCCVSARHGQKLSVAQIDREIAALAATSGRVLEFARVNGRVVDARTLETKKILSDLSGYAQRGQVLGLLGPSGSGKTSLLNALAAVENGKCQLTGEVRVDGKAIGRNYRRVAAYVQQDDALFATLTVRESLQYSAELRLPARVPAVVKREMVSRILMELNLAHVEHARIGSSGGAGDSSSRGISGGERRRVSIGMELVTSPQILFLDEPTSGLDSSSANAVVQLVKELASHGRIVVMSIHQPSAKAFMLLDQVMLLAKGKMLYHGSPQRAKRHFEAIGFKCPENENVADFILDVASDVKNIPMVRAAFKAKHGDKTPMKKVPLTPGTPAEEQPQLQSYYSSRSSISSESSPFMDAEGDALDTPRVHEMLNMPGTPGTPASLRSPSSPPGLGSPERIQLPSSLGANSPHSTAPPSRSHWIELRVIFQRTARNIFRHRSLLFLHLALSVTLALFGGLIFNHVTNDLAGFQNRSGAFYFILTFFGFASMSSMDLFIAERGIFLRETGAMYYGAFSYFIAKAVLDTLLLRVLPAAIFASIFYWIMGLQATLAHFAMFQTTLVLFNVAAGSISILVGVLSRNVGTANLSATVVFLVMLLFGGFLLNSQTMPKSVGWLKHFSIFSYAFEILMTNELKGLLMKFDAPGYPSVPVYGDVFLKTLGMDYANRYYDLVALAMIAGALQVLAFLFLSLQVPVRQELVDEAYDGDDSAASKGRSATMQVEVDEVKLADLKKRSPVAAKADPEDTEDADAGTGADVV